MSSIGGYSLYILAGKMDVPAVQIREITRPGVDGAAYQDIGLRSRVSQLQTMCDFDSDAAAIIAMDNYKALQGYFVTVVDEMAVTYTSVMVLSVVVSRTPIVGAVAGGFGSEASGRTLVYADWVLKADT